MVAAVAISLAFTRHGAAPAAAPIHLASAGHIRPAYFYHG